MRLLFGLREPLYFPPLDLYIFTASCALRADHLPGDPPFDPRITCDLTDSHSFGLERTALVGERERERRI